MYEIIGAGFGGALLVSVVTYLLNRSKNNNLQDNSGLSSKVVFKDTCQATHKAVDERLNRIDHTIEKGFGTIGDKLDKLFDQKG